MARKNDDQKLINKFILKNHKDKNKWATTKAAHFKIARGNAVISTETVRSGTTITNGNTPSAIITTESTQLFSSGLQSAPSWEPLSYLSLAAVGTENTRGSRSKLRKILISLKSAMLRWTILNLM